MNYDDEQFTEEGTFFFFYGILVYTLYSCSFYSPAIFVILWCKCVLIVGTFRGNKIERPQHTGSICTYQRRGVKFKTFDSNEKRIALSLLRDTFVPERPTKIKAKVHAIQNRISFGFIFGVFAYRFEKIAIDVFVRYRIIINYILAENLSETNLIRTLQQFRP